MMTSIIRYKNYKMSKEFVALIAQCIDKKFCLKRESNSWTLHDRQNGTQTELCSPNRNSFAFTLDESNSKKMHCHFFILHRQNI